MLHKLKRVVSCLVAVALTVGLISVVSGVLETKSSDRKYAEFFSEEHDFDVLFVGNSHINHGVSPLDLWNEYGFTSYSIGCAAAVVPTSYWILMNALEYTNPKVVVIDPFLINMPYKVNMDNYSVVHNGLDAFPLSLTKIKAVKDLLDDPKVDQAIADGLVTEGEQRQKIGLLWDFSVYHSRWNELTEKDFETQTTPNKGADDTVGIYPMSFEATEEKKEAEGYGLTYLQKIIDECRERNIKVLMTFLPANSVHFPIANWLADFAAENEVDYLNFTNMDLLKENIDFEDKTAHVNPSGSKKITSVIGEYIDSNYDLTNHKDDPEYASWNSDFEEYVQYELGNLTALEKTDLYLMMLNNPVLSCRINGTESFSETYTELLDNISTQGSCELNIVGEQEIPSGQKNAPDASIEVMYQNEVVDQVYSYGGKIVRAE